MPDDKKKKGFGIGTAVANVGKDLYSGAVRGATEINKFLGLNAFEPTRKAFIEPGEQAATRLEKETEAKTKTGKYAQQFVRGIGGFVPSLTADIVTGGATKVALAPRIASQAAKLLEAIPSFAVGMGVRGAVEGYKEGKGIGKIPSTLARGVEETGKGIVYGKVGPSVSKLAAVGAVDAFYEASKEGRLPTEEEVISNAANNAAFGVVFKALSGGKKGKLPIENSAVERGLNAAQIEAKRTLGKLRSQEGSIELLSLEERRKNLDLRKRVADMTPEERAQALYTDQNTGLRSKRAYEETERLPYQASIDVDGLKYVNDITGNHEAGDLLLRRVGEALESASKGEERAYHFHGDEFALEGMSKAELQKISADAKQYLKDNPIEVTDLKGNTTQYVPDFSVGIAEDLVTADKAMLMNKKARRVERGAGPTQETPTSRALEKDELNQEISSELNAEDLDAERAALEPPVQERPKSVAERFQEEVDTLTEEAETASQRVSRLTKQEEIAPVEEAPVEIASKIKTEENVKSFQPVLTERGTLDVSKTKEQLPPIPEGQTRLYRVEKAPTVDENIPEALRKAPEEGQPERYYTDDLEYAGYYQESYGPESRLQYIDVPKSIADKYRVSGKKTNAEFLLPENLDLSEPVKPKIKKSTLKKELTPKQPKDSLEPILLTDEVQNKPRDYFEQPPTPPSGPTSPKGGGQPPSPPKKPEGGVLPASDGAIKLGVERFINWFANNRFSLERVQNRLKQMDEGIDLLLKETNRPKQTAAKTKMVWQDTIMPMLKDAAESGRSFSDAENYAYAVHAPQVNQVLRLDNARYNLLKIFKAIGDKNKKEFLKKYVKKGDKPTPENMAKLLDLAFEDFKNFKKVQTIKKQWDIFAEKPSGLTDAEAAAIVRELGGNKKLESARKKLRELTDITLDTYHDAGIIPDAEYNAMKAKYNEYVPLHREGFEQDFKSTGQGIQPAGKPYKTRAGSTRRAVNIFANAVANYETMIQRVAKAESDKIFAKMINANPDSNFWSIEKVKQSPRRDVYGNISYYPNINDVAKHEMRLMIKGKQYLARVNPDNPTLMRMLNVLKGTANSQVGTFMRTYAKVNRYLARMNTSWYLEFMFGNYPKDLETALVNIHSTGVKLPSIKSVVKNSFKNIGAIYQVERGGVPTTRQQKLYVEAREAGAIIDWADTYKDIPDLAKKLNKQFDMLQGRRIPRKMLTGLGSLLESANKAVEGGIRLHVYDLAIQQGFSKAQAARIASAITVDFTQHGTAGPVINALWLFGNAGIGGPYRMISGMIKSKTIRYKIVPAIIGAGFVNGLYNAFVGGKDKDGQYNIHKKDEFIKERNMVFMLPEALQTKYLDNIQIPAAYGYSFFWSFGGEMARVFTDVNYSSLEGSARMVNSFANSFNPIGGGTLYQTISPTIFDTLVQIAENKTWFGGDLIPPENPLARIKTPDYLRSWKSTSPIYKEAAKDLYMLTGGDTVKSGIDVSPETLELWLDTVGGGAFTFAKRVFNIPAKIITGEEIATQEIPIVRRFAGAKSEWTDSRTYYDNSTQVLKVKDALDNAKNDEVYESLNKKYGFMRELFSYVQAAEYDLKQARKTKRYYEAKNLKPLVEREDKNIQDIYVRFNKRFYEVMKRENERR